jgi:soluble lytic murein transglycosylase-like protein
MILARRSAFVLWILTFSPSFAKELVYLTSGFQLEAQSHTESNQTLVLRTTAGTLELPRSAVTRIETVADNSSQTAEIDHSSASKQAPEQLIENVAVAEGLPPEFVRSVAQIESGLRQDALSAKGAVGLMQLMPGTAADLGVKAGWANENAQGGAKYLRNLLLRYEGDAVLALAAYNAGPGSVDRFGGVPPYSETRRYVDRVLREFAREQKLGPKELSPTSPHPSRPISTD